MSGLYVTTASVIHQSPGAEEIGGVSLLCWPDVNGGFTHHLPTVDRDLAQLVDEASACPGWFIGLAAALFHPTDSRSSTYPKLAKAAVDHLPDAEGTMDANPMGLANFYNQPGPWALRHDAPSPPITRPIVSRVQAWRGARCDLIIAFGYEVSSIDLPSRDAVAVAAALTGQPMAAVLRLEVPTTWSDEVAVAMIGRITRVTTAQAAAVL